MEAIRALEWVLCPIETWSYLPSAALEVVIALEVIYGHHSMTIVASVKVRDGLILGTDSMTQISQNTPEGPQFLKAYSNARKLFQIKDRPIGVACYGLGNVGQRSIEGVVLDFCSSQPVGRLKVGEVAQGLYEFVTPLYEGAFESVETEGRPPLGFYIAGYSHREPFPEEFEFLLPRDTAPFAPRPAQVFGASWRGIDIAFTRLYKGFDPRLIERLTEAGIGEEDQKKIFDGLETPVVYDGMPVQDAVNFCEYILETTIGYTTFHAGVPGCGYPLQVATILADIGFTWVARPEPRIMHTL